MPSVYPGANDTFTVPSAPSTTPLSSAGTSTRNHVQSHEDIGDALRAVQENAAILNHDHSGTGSRPTPKLKQVNTHQSPDTDTAPTALHHTLGPGGNQAAPGNHSHDYNSPQITGQPYLICTSTTRPGSPVPGMRIFETDTNRVRVWAKIPPASTFSWRLCLEGVVPFVKARQTRAQNVPQGSGGTIAEWHTELEDSSASFNPSTSMTNFYAPEPGLYQIRAVWAWEVGTILDASGIGLRVNGGVRGNDPADRWFGMRFLAGYIQNMEMEAEFRLNAGDYASVWIGQNAFVNQLSSKNNTAQASRITFRYIGF